MKKAKTNSNELASETTGREAETEREREKYWKESGREIEQKKSGSGTNI